MGTYNSHTKLRVPFLAERLHQEYWEHEIVPGAVFPSAREIAERFGVSRLTADRAIRQLVNNGLLYREKGSGTFFRGIEKKKSLLIGYAAQATYALGPMRTESNHALQVLHDEGAEVKQIFHDVLQDPESAQEALSELDGLLFSADLLDPATLALLKQFEKPIVVMRYDFPNQYGCHQVVKDFTPAFDAIVKKIEPGKKIWIVEENHHNAVYRRNEFLKALERGGFELSEVRLVPMNFIPPFEIKNYNYALTLADEVRDKFVFSTSDVQSDIFLNAFVRKGLTPGVDFDWVSCDNLARYGYGTEGLPALTTVDCFSNDVSVESVRLLLERIRRPSPYQTLIRIPAQLIERETAWQRPK